VAKRARAVAPRFDRPVIISLALAALTAIVYAPVRTFELVNWDDPSYVTENPIVRGGLTPASALWALTTTHSPYWHPMTWLSLLLDVSLFGGDVGAYHVTSVAIHIATTVVLFLLLRRMTAAVVPSAFVAAIFAVHPLHVESVAWIAERKDVLSTLFWALTIWAYVSYVRAPSVGRYVVVVVWYALALMSKPMVMTLPVVLLLLDWWPLGRWRAGPAGSDDPAYRRRGGAAHVRLVVEKLPLFAMAVATGIATVVVQRQVGAVAGLEALPLSQRVENAIVSCVVYIWKTVWPSNLAAFYPLHSYPLWLVLLAAAGLTALTIAAVLVRTRRPHVMVGWLWFLVTVAPVIGLTQAGEQARADRFMYVPMIGLLIIPAWELYWLPVRSSQDIRRSAGGGGGLPTRFSPELLVSFLGLLGLLVYASVARAQVMTWADSETLWRHAVAAVPRNYIAYQKLGQALRDRNQLDEALENLRLALANAPPHSPAFEAMVRDDLGLVLNRHGRPDDAAREFDAAVRLDPEFAEAQLNLANALAADGRFSDAEPHYQAAIALKPDLVEPQVGLGGVLLQQRRPADAIPHYEAAIRRDPSLAQAHNGLGAAYGMQGRDADAMREYDEALRLDPSLVTAHFNVAVLMAREGRTDEARHHLDTALQIDPGYTPARDLRARLQ
jgi:Flp pilus assembly protein TadD